MDAVDALKSRMEGGGCATQRAHAETEAPRSESEDRLAALEVSAQAAAVRLAALEASLAAEASPGTSAAAGEADAVNASAPPKEPLALMPTAGAAAPASELTTGAASVAGTQQNSNPNPNPDFSALAFIPEAGAAEVPHPQNAGADSVPPNPNPDSGVIALVSPDRSTAGEVPSPAGGVADGVVYVGASPTCTDSGSAKRAARDAKGPPHMRRGGDQSGMAAGRGGTRSRGGRASGGGGRQSAHAKQGCACTMS